jgi:hypothetical protein
MAKWLPAWVELFLLLGLTVPVRRPALVAGRPLGTASQTSN